MLGIGMVVIAAAGLMVLLSGDALGLSGKRYSMRKILAMLGAFMLIFSVMAGPAHAKKHVFSKARFEQAKASIVQQKAADQPVTSAAVTVEQHHLIRPDTQTTVTTSSDGTVELCQTCGNFHQPVRHAVGTALVAVGSALDSSAIAQAKANQQAREGRMRHVGGSFGAGRFEGVGFSTRGPQEAVQVACYWGQKTPVGIGVAQGRTGWYSCVLYR